MLNRSTINAAAELQGTNSKVGKQYSKCIPGELCNEIYLVDRIVKCANCKKIKAI